MAVKEINIPFTVPIPILIENIFTTVKYSSFSRENPCLQRCVDIPSIGDDLLTCVQEERNENDKNVVAVIWNFMQM